MTPAAPSASSPLVTVVIVNFNGRAYLNELLQTLQAQTVRDFETLLVDNCSSDKSVALVRDKYPEVRLQLLAENRGFSQAANLGAHLSRGRYLAFLNPDVKLDPAWLEQLVATAENSPETAAVACKMLLYDRPHLLNGVGGAMNRLGYSWDRGMFEADQGQYDDNEEILFASAGAALFSRQHFLGTGGFDERYFMYHEDVDLGWRFWLLGYRVVTAPRARVYHHFGATTRQEKSLLWRELQGERHNIRTLAKHYEAANLARAYRDLLLLRQPWRRKLGQLQNFVWNLKCLPDTLSRRRWIQRRRVRSDADLKYLIVESKDVPIRL